ncbi:MAG: hypothetical protein WA130_00635 [Candidatus Methanoperedens sp.]
MEIEFKDDTIIFNRELTLLDSFVLDFIDFIDRYVEWIKATPNKVWSKQYKDFIDSSFQKQ